MRRRAVYLSFAILIFAVEVLIATRLRNAPFVRGSLGDVLVVILIYCAALSLREFRRIRLAVGVFLFACAIEGSQYFHLARALGLRPGGVLWIALGATFQWGDILCYLVGCATVLSLDLLITKRRCCPPRGRASGCVSSQTSAILPSQNRTTKLGADAGEKAQPVRPD